MLDPEPNWTCTIVIHTIFWKSVNLRLTRPSGPIRYSILKHTPTFVVFLLGLYPGIFWTILSIDAFKFLCLLLKKKYITVYIMILNMIAARCLTSIKTMIILRQKVQRVRRGRQCESFPFCCTQQAEYLLLTSACYNLALNFVFEIDLEL